MNIKSTGHLEHTRGVLNYLNENFYNNVTHYDKCSAAVSELQRYLASFHIDPSNVEDEFFDVAFFRLIRDCFEIGALCYLKTKEFVKFEIVSSQLRMMYTNLDQFLKESYHKYHIIALSLVSSVAKGNMDDFYFTISAINPGILANNDYLRIPMELQSLFTTGSYRQLFEMVENLPHEGFEYFSDLLLDQVRNCISLDLQYCAINVAPSDLKELLYLKTDEQVAAFISQIGWGVDNEGLINFDANATYSDVLPIENFKFSSNQANIPILDNLISSIEQSLSIDPVTSYMTKDVIEMTQNVDRLI